MQITAAAPPDITPALNCLVAAFANDPITGFLLEPGPNYQERLTQFFSLLMRARMALGMPVLVARDADTNRVLGAAMGYSTAPAKWPTEIEDKWNRFEADIPGLADRLARYDEIAEKSKPPTPHFYLGVIGVDPAMHGQGLGAQLLQSFCELSAQDPLSSGVYLETANPSNVAFYERAGFEVTGQGSLGSANLWCMFLRHGQRRGA